MRDLAGDDIHFIAARERDEDVGIGDPGGFQHRGVGPVARHHADVDAVLQIAQHLFVGVDHRDLVGRLERQAVCGSAPDLAGAEYQNLHRPTCYMSSSRARLSISHFAPSCSKVTWTRACGPCPSTLSTTPSPNLPCRTRVPRRTPPLPDSASTRPRRAPPSVTPSGRASWMRGRSSSSNSGGISWMKREATL